MGFLNIVGCCCGGPGFTRLYVSAGGFGGGFNSLGGVRPINPTDDLASHTQTKHWPCWTVGWYLPGVRANYAGEATGGVLRALAAGSDYGYVLHHMIFNTKAKAMIHGARGVYSLELVKDCELADPTETVPRLSGGASLNLELISAEDGAVIIDAAYPAGTWTFRTAGFSGGNNDRLYGFNVYADAILGAGDAHFKAWSVLYDGTDYTEEFVLDNDGSGSAIPTTMNVVETSIFCTNVNDDGDLEVYENGSIVATMDGSVGENNANAVSRIDAQLLAIVGSVAGGAAILCVVADGESTNDQEVTFIATEEETPVEYFPIGLGYDPEKRCPVVVWDRGTYLGGYMTYITKPITPGNILGQDGVKVYANWPSLGYNAFGFQPDDGFWNVFRYPAPVFWGVVIPGRMPRPLTVTGGVIEQPPPPTPEPNCDGLGGCDEMLLTLWLSGFTNYTEITTDGGFPLGNLITEWFGENLNIVVELPYKAGSYTFEIPLVEVDEFGIPITGDYDDPGILIRRRTAEDDTTYPPPDNKREDWAYTLRVTVTCASGRVTISPLSYDYQVFQGTTGGDTWPTFVGTDTTQLGLVDTDLPGASLDNCSTGYMGAIVEYQNLIAFGLGSGGRWYWMNAIIGGQPAP